jgi:plasmid stabilization system protein ParE
MSGYVFHPDAYADLIEIWEFIAKDSIDAAGRVVAEVGSGRR